MRSNSVANANGFANEIAKISSSLRKFPANGSLRQNSLANANAMAWCTQIRSILLWPWFLIIRTVFLFLFLGKTSFLSSFRAFYCLRTESYCPCLSSPQYFMYGRVFWAGDRGAAMDCPPPPPKGPNRDKGIANGGL